MNAFYEHHKNSIRFHYRCFDRILLNAIIQPFQQEERVVGFFNTYRQLYPVTRDVLRDGRKSAMWTIPRTWGLTNHHQPTIAIGQSSRNPSDEPQACPTRLVNSNSPSNSSWPEG